MQWQWAIGETNGGGNRGMATDGQEARAMFESAARDCLGWDIRRH
jgi:hypothetical protein